jgi:virulence-associated protein VapD
MLNQKIGEDKMVFKKILWVSTCMLMLTACGDRPVYTGNISSPVTHQANLDKESYQKQLDFQKEVSSDIMGEMTKLFSKKIKIRNSLSNVDEEMDTFDDSKFNDFGSLYIETKDVDDLHYVIAVSNENAPKVKQMKTALERFGNKVRFVKERHSQKELRKILDEMEQVLQDKGITIEGGINVKTQKAEIIADMGEELKQQFINKYGEDAVSVVNEPAQEVTAY